MPGDLADTSRRAGGRCLITRLHDRLHRTLRDQSADLSIAIYYHDRRQLIEICRVDTFERLIVRYFPDPGIHDRAGRKRSRISAASNDLLTNGVLARDSDRYAMSIAVNDHN